MVNKIRTTHVGSLPRTQELLDANLERSAGTISDEKFHEILERSVADVVKANTATSPPAPWTMAPGGTTPLPAWVA